MIGRESSILGDYFLRALGVFGMWFCWAPVFFPKKTVVWKGGNHAPLSRRSKLVSALTWTAWCLVVFGIAPIFCAALFAIGVLSLFMLSRQDRQTLRCGDRNPRAEADHEEAVLVAFLCG
jgi:hypothetical protein